jgi:hypothetical protein
MKLCCSAASLAASRALTLCLALASCVAPVDEEPVEATGEAEQSLVASNWSAPTPVSASPTWRPQIATLAGTTYMVHDGPGNGLRWRQLVGSNWTEPVMIRGQSSTQRVSLAAFNGFLYMVHSNVNNGHILWVSRFNPVTEEWSGAFQIPHISYQVPAIAAFDNRLYLIGADPTTKRLWSATMTADEVFSPPSPMYGHFSTGRISAAVYACKLYIAHRDNETYTVEYSSFDGTDWTRGRTIPGGRDGAELASAEPVIAARGDYLHLLHQVNNSIYDVPVWWTYFDGDSWALEVTIPGASTLNTPALTHGGDGLVAITWRGSEVASLQYTQPLPPIIGTSCFVVKPPIDTL